jgi:hypothetical protein
MAAAIQFPDERTSVAVTIAFNDATGLSTPADLGGCSAVRIGMPAAWTAASLTFQVSVDGVSYANLYKSDGTEYSVSAAASREILLSPADFAGIRFLKVRSGTSGTPVTQLTADRILTITARPV